VPIAKEGKLFQLPAGMVQPYISSCYWRRHIFWNRWYFSHGNWNGYVSIPCSVWRP